MLIRYNRRKNGTKNGVFVARPDTEGRIVIGWSKCHNHLDQFDRSVGLVLATQRIDVAAQRDRLMVADEAHVPHSMRPAFRRFVESCQRYYKTDEIFVVAPARKSQTTHPTGCCSGLDTNGCSGPCGGINFDPCSVHPLNTLGEIEVTPHSFPFIQPNADTAPNLGNHIGKDTYVSWDTPGPKNV